MIADDSGLPVQLGGSSGTQFLSRCRPDDGARRIRTAAVKMPRRLAAVNEELWVEASMLSTGKLVEYAPTRSGEDKKPSSPGD